MLFLRRLFSTQKISPVEQLESLYKLSTNVNSTPSTTKKYELLTKFPACHSILERIYDPHLRHHVTSKAVKKYMNAYPQTNDSLPFRNLTDLLDALSSRAITGNAANEAVALFYKTYCTTKPLQDLFWRVIDRNLKIGVSVTTIRNLLDSSNLPETKGKNQRFNVALAIPFTHKAARLDFQKESWFVSQKLDGVRCIAMVRFDNKSQHHDIQFYSRTGRPFTSLKKVKLDIENQVNASGLKTDFALDGEICAYSKDKPSNEDFITTMKQVRRINEDMENPVFQAFDMISLDHFLASKGDQLFSQRQKELKRFIGRSPLSHFKMVQQNKLKSMDQLEDMKVSYVQSGWEGLILRKDGPYEGKRTRNMLKVKEWVDAEYIVESIETGLMRMPDSGENKLVMTSVNIVHKGNTVGVGSGFTIHSRVAYAEDPSLIVGKPITVRYFSESKKEDGTTSLRFPSVKVVYENGKRDV